MTSKGHTTRRKWSFIPAETWRDQVSGKQHSRTHGILEDGKGFIASLNCGHADTLEYGRVMAAADDLLGAAITARDSLGPWLSAALEDKNVCDEFKNDILQWLSINETAITKAQRG